MGNNNQEPKFFKIMRIVAPCLLVVGVILIVLACTVLSKEEWYGKEPFWPLLVPGIILAFFSIPSFFMGFTPKISKTMAKANMYINQEIAPDMIKAQKNIIQNNQKDLTDIANTSADISSEAITKTTRAIRKGFKDTMFCKHCGSEIDKDSAFCKSCGGKQ